MPPRMNPGSSGFDVFLHGVIAVLVGGLAFRMCLNYQGHGSFPGVAIIAGIATGMIAFIFSLVLIDMFPERHKQKVRWGMIAFPVLIHIAISFS